MRFVIGRWATRGRWEGALRAVVAENSGLETDESNVRRDFGGDKSTEMGIWKV